MPAWQDANKISLIDTGIDKMSGDIPIVFDNNNTSETNLVYTISSTKTRWFVSCVTTSKGGGPQVFKFVVLNCGV